MYIEKKILGKMAALKWLEYNFWQDKSTFLDGQKHFHFQIISYRNSISCKIFEKPGMRIVNRIIFNIKKNYLKQVKK